MVPKPVAALALAAVLLLGGGCGDVVSPGIRVGDRSLGHDRVLDEIGEWAGNPMLQQQFDPVAGPVPASYSSQISTAVVRFRIVREVINAEAERRQLVPSRDQRAQAQAALYGDPQTASQIEQGFSEDYARSLLDEGALEVALVEDLGEDAFVEWVNEALADERIEVSSRFGSWDPENQIVVPPSGPATTGSELTGAPVPVGGAGTP